MSNQRGEQTSTYEMTGTPRGLRVIALVIGAGVIAACGGGKPTTPLSPTARPGLSVSDAVELIKAAIPVSSPCRELRTLQIQQWQAFFTNDGAWILSVNGSRQLASGSPGPQQQFYRFIVNATTKQISEEYSYQGTCIPK